MTFAPYIAILGIILNFIALFIHVKWLDKDPTHEDVVLSMFFFLSFIPFFTFALTMWDVYREKVLDIHHGVKEEK